MCVETLRSIRRETANVHIMKDIYLCKGLNMTMSRDRSGSPTGGFDLCNGLLGRGDDIFVPRNIVCRSREN